MSDDVLQEAKTLKSRARRHREGGRYDAAAKFLDHAIKILDNARAEISRGEHSLAENEIVRELSDCYGSLGGVCRSAGWYARAVEAYDEGEKLESNEQYDIVSSYNLVQRLVTRILLSPELTGSDVWVVKDRDLWGELRKAAEIIKKQWSLRKGDPWYLADRALVSLLLLEPEEAEASAWSDFRNAASIYAVTSTLRTVSELLKGLESVRGTNGNSCFHQICYRLSQARAFLVSLEGQF